MKTRLLVPFAVLTGGMVFAQGSPPEFPAETGPTLPTRCDASDVGTNGWHYEGPYGKTCFMFCAAHEAPYVINVVAIPYRTVIYYGCRATPTGPAGPLGGAGCTGPFCGSTQPGGGTGPGGGGGTPSTPPNTPPTEPPTVISPAPVPTTEQLCFNISLAEQHRDDPFKYLWFAWKVWPSYGEWDLKNQYRNRGLENLGNANFGALGAALGIPLPLLLRGAGLAQAVSNVRDVFLGHKPAWEWPWGNFMLATPYGDDPRDQNLATLGYNLYLSGMNGACR